MGKGDSLHRHPVFRLVSECRNCHQTGLHYILELRRYGASKPYHGAVRECVDCGWGWFERFESPVPSNPNSDPWRPAGARRSLSAPSRR